jgi:hypothetical protein
LPVFLACYTRNTRRYASSIVFEDPITRVTDINAYQLMIRAIKTLFNVTFDLHDIQITQADEVTTRCASCMDYA